MDNLNQTDSIVIYQTTDGETYIDVKFGVSPTFTTYVTV